MHAGTIGVEDTRHADVQTILTVGVEKQRLSIPFAFIVTPPLADGIDVAPVSFGLWMDGGVAVHFRSGGLKNAHLGPLGQPQHVVDGAVHRSLGGLHRIVLIMNGRGRTGEIIDLVHLDIEREDHVMALAYQAVAQVRADKSGAAGNQNTFAFKHGHELKPL